MKNPLTTILINSTLAFVAAFIMTTIIHEGGHYVSYALFGENPTLFHNYVQTSAQSMDVHVRVTSAMAGPLISLVQGLVFGYVVTREKRNTPTALLFLWLSLLGFVNFFGYLVMTPFTTTGDTGKVAELLNMDDSIRIAIAVIGFAVLLVTIFRIARYFAHFIPVQNDEELKTKYVYRLMFFPIVLGSLVNALLAFPAVAILSIIYPATSSYVIMSSFPVILKTTHPTPTRSILEDRIQISLVALAIGAVVFNRFLTMGIG